MLNRHISSWRHRTQSARCRRAPFRLLSHARAVASLMLGALIADGALAQSATTPSSASTTRADAPTRAAAPEGWTLVWSDEFDGDRIDPDHWDHELGDGFYSYDTHTWISGWGNGELQTYTREPKNAAVVDGALRIRAFKESYQGHGYTSARLISRMRDGRPLFNKRYGRFEIRAKLPTGQGVWPAIWLLPQENTYGTWAASGEIDIVETRGQEPRTIHGTIHYGSRWPANASSTASHTLPEGQGIDQYHTYALEWEPGEIRWYIDGQQYARQTSWWASGKKSGGQGIAPTSPEDLHPWPAPFDRPFYLVMNIAIGGQFPGNPDDATPFPAEMWVDYVRVYDRSDGYGPPPAQDPATLPFSPR